MASTPPCSPVQPFGLNQRSQLVLDLRRSGETLDSIGTRLGVTRERIRQIENGAKKKVQTSSDFDSIIRSCRSMLENRGYLAKETLSRIVGAVVPGASPGTTLVAIDLAHGFFLDHDEAVEHRGIVVAKKELVFSLDLVIEAFIEEALETGHCRHNAILKRIRDTPMPLMDNVQIERFTQSCFQELTEIASVSRAEERENATARQLAKRILEEEGEPLHHSELSKRVNEQRARLGLDPLVERYIHSQLVKREDFSYRDQGTYGLKEWGDDVPFIKGLIINTLNRSGAPLSFGQIRDGVEEVRQVKIGSLKMYLDIQPEFYESRSSKYGLREWLPEIQTLKTDRDFVECSASKRRLTIACEPASQS